MRSVRTAIAVLGIAALGAAGCGAPGDSAAGNRKLADGKTFTIAIAVEPGTLDPAITSLSVARGVGAFLYSRLISLGPRGEFLTGLAAKWEADTKTAKFTLRPGITCSDGAPLTAADVAANIAHIGDPKNNSPLIGLQVMPGTTATADPATGTVTVTSGTPDAFLLNNIGTLPIVCGKGLADRSRLAKGEQGSGMYVLSEIVPNDHYTLTRRKDFAWGPGDWPQNQPGLPDKIVFRVIPNEATAANLLVSGQINAATVLGPDQQRLTALKLARVDQKVPIGMLTFNQAAGHPGQDPAVRRALVQAVDLNEIGKVLTNGAGKPSRGVVTYDGRPCTGDNVTGNLPAPDPAAAAKALDAAGWPAGPDGIRSKNGKPLAIKVIQPTVLGPTLAAAAELMQQRWQAVGARVQIQPVDAAGMNQALFSTGDWEVSMAPLSFTLPSQLLPFFAGTRPPQGVNYGHLDNKEFTDLSRQAAAQPGTSGCALWERAEAALVKSLDMVPYYDSVRPTFMKGAEFYLAEGIEPTSIRMFAG
ncbi:ABC transporter substrate-binding protein [Crossiella sp. CA198]|uniref:ABC transporter substrate-binding protein n=1 Tax=Crossiella sp. CA198 TaxID=3455607 RepID=UPI003F8D16B6